MFSRNLTPAQRDGLACVTCHGDDAPMIPVGTFDGCQVFACAATCTAQGAEEPPTVDCSHCGEPSLFDELALVESAGDWYAAHWGCVNEARAHGYVVVAV
ncbi:hypothetical protein ACFW9O_18310 [Streptomyces sp. NPDC059499]|uniref:hypothetical protein n=1 Tax=Streptomyces sp. NPDC059499 TaxID=3346852 RepID=UPI003692D067